MVKETQRSIAPQNLASYLRACLRLVSAWEQGRAHKGPEKLLILGLELQTGRQACPHSWGPCHPSGYCSCCPLLAVSPPAFPEDRRQPWGIMTNVTRGHVTQGSCSSLLTWGMGERGWDGGRGRGRGGGVGKGTPRDGTGHTRPQFTNSEDPEGLPSAWCHHCFPWPPLSKVPLPNLHSCSLGGNLVIPFA